MGLDMYVYARKIERDSFSSWSIYDEDTTKTLDYPTELKTLEDDIAQRNYKSAQELTYIDYQIGYFRKFNALHKFIVDRFADGGDYCQDIPLRLKELDMILTVLKAITADNAYAVMPTETGFFFGSTNVDEYYLADVEYAIDMFTKARAFLSKQIETGHEDEWYIVYHASW